VATARFIGPGRAGGSLSTALARVGWDIAWPSGRGDDVTDAAAGVDLLVIATPDGAIASLARAVRPDPHTVVTHLSGALGLDALDPHPRRAALHPLAALPDPVTGADRLRSGITFAVAGDPLVRHVVGQLGGRAVEVPDELRPLYHATAVMASNHLVALSGQVADLAAHLDVPVEVYWQMMAATLDDVAARGPAAALTGPAARGDLETIRRHLDALPAAHVDAYRALSERAAALAAAPAGMPA